MRLSLHATCLVLLAVVLPGCAPVMDRPASSGWIETQMFFGLTGPGGVRISDADWHDFVNRSVTPRFPDGLTIVYGDGQFRGDDGVVHTEPSAILILLRHADDDGKLIQIAREYDARFHQESVLKTDFPANVNFISGK